MRFILEEGLLIVGYNRNTQVFTFTDPLTYQRRDVKLSVVREKAKALWDRDFNWNKSQQASSSSDSDYSVDEINSERNTPTNNTVYGTGLHSFF